MDLFDVVRLAEPKVVRVGQRPLRAGEVPILQATAGRVMELNLEEGSGETPPLVLDVAPINVAGHAVQAQDAQPDAEKSVPESSDSVEITKVVDAPEEGNRGEKRKEPIFGGDGASSSKRKRHVGGTASLSSKEESYEGGVQHSNAGKNVTESSPPL